MSDQESGSRVRRYVKRRVIRRLVARIGAAKLAAILTAAGFLSVLCIGMLAALAGGGASISTAQAATRCTVSGGRDSPPQRLVPIYAAASEAAHLGARGPSILAAINWVETGFGTNMNNTTGSGAEGWMMFMPETWATYGVDANHDGAKDPYDPEDAIVAAANYLHVSGAPRDWSKAIFAYNHATWYVEKVEREAERFSGPMVCTTESPGVTGDAQLQRVETLSAPREFRAIPSSFWVGGGPAESVDSRIWPDVIWVLRSFNLQVTAAREEGHNTHGDGTAVDLVPTEGKGWDETARAAAETLGWRESCGYSGTAPVCPLVPAIQFLGYNGYPGHGDPDHAGENAHLHISWQSSSFGSGPLSPPPGWVRVFPLG